MWVFLLTEILFFGGLFLVYTIYRTWYPEAFAAASHHLDIPLGTINTAVLIGSSLTMALAVQAAQLNARKGIMLFLVLTMILGGVFLGIKGVEYSHKFHEHLVPGALFQFEAQYFRPAQIFFSLYFIMTGLHALHMIIGMGLMIWMMAVGLQRHDSRRLLLACRGRRVVLALRRYRLDISLPAALSDRAARGRSLEWLSTQLITSSPGRSITRSSARYAADAITVGVAYIDLGPINTIAAIVIACFKAMIVVLYFMHVKFGTRLVKLTVIAGLYWMGILLTLTLSDYLTRGWGTYGQQVR